MAENNIPKKYDVPRALLVDALRNMGERHADHPDSVIVHMAGLLRMAAVELNESPDQEQRIEAQAARIAALESELGALNAEYEDQMRVTATLEMAIRKMEADFNDALSLPYSGDTFPRLLKATDDLQAALGGGERKS